MQSTTFIALRYILGKRSLNIITVITFISILGITTGVAVIIVVMSIFNGFRDFTENQIFKHDPHIRIVPEKGNSLNENTELSKYLINNNNIESFAPIIKDRIAVLDNDNMLISEMISVDDEHIDYLDDFTSFIALGSMNRYLANDNYILIGAGIADQLSLYPGDTINLVSPELIEMSLRTFRKASPVKAIVSGVFQTNNPKYDHNMIIGKIGLISKLSFKQKYADYIDIKINNPYENEKLEKGLNSEFQGIKTLSWKELNIELYNVMQFEQLAAFTILSIIILIAVFNILASLTMSVIDKKSDIGALKAMGATNEFIKLIFRKVGFFSGLISTFAGTILGLGFCYLQINYKLFRVDTTKFLIDAIPIKIDYFYVIAIIILSLILTYFATFYPAKRASETLIINSLRDE
jgi:lipoprotein-releasing system permease protein